MKSRGLFEICRLAALVALAVPQVAWLALPIPLTFRLGEVALVGLAVARPKDALLVLAGLAPLATALAMLFPTPFAGGYWLEQAVLAVVTGVVARRRADDAGTRTGDIAFVFALVAVCSAAALLPTRLLANDPSLSAWQRLGELLHGEYYTATGLWMPVIRTAAMVEGMALLWAVELTVRRDPPLATRVIRLALAGNAAAALLTLTHMAGTALQTGSARTALPQLLLTARYSLHNDVNAQASIFVLVLLAGVALLARPAWRAAATGAGLCLVAMGLWLTGSRTALAVAAMVPIAMVIIHAIRSRGRRRWFAVAALVGAVAGVGLVVRVYPSSRNFALTPSVASRVILAKTAARMTASAPILGAGIGRFQELSTSFGSNALVPTYRSSQAAENAHNNFLQILAEEGIVGLVGFVLVQGMVMGLAVRAQRAAPSRLRTWLLAGLVGFVLTEMTGHPLLVPDAAFAFWLFLGLLAALTTRPEAAVWRTRVWWAVVVVLLVSVPVRESQARAAVDLEYRSTGLSPWNTDDEGVRYRLGGAAFSLYLPAGRDITLPLRRVPGAADPLSVTIRLEGQLLEAVTVSGNEWQTFRIECPLRGRGYERVDFSVLPGGTAQVPAIALYVAKEVAR